jgi:hypothetical protein
MATSIIPNKSASEKHRLEGNRIFASVESYLTNQTRSMARLKESLVCYNQAVGCALNHDELSSAHKNCSASALEIFKYGYLMKIKIQIMKSKLVLH